VQKIPVLLFSNLSQSDVRAGERFIWCALTVWTHLTDSDVESFSKVKTVRDQIAHGEIAAPPADAVQLVEHIASKLQLAPATV
jgi:hypothetical protein